MNTEANGGNWQSRKRTATRRGVSARNWGRNYLRMEALEQRNLLAVTAVDDTYVVNEGESFTAGALVTDVVPLRSMWSRFEGITRTAPNNVYPDANQLPVDWNDVNYNTANPSFGSWTAPAVAPFAAGGVDGLTAPTTALNAANVSGGGSTFVTSLYRTNFTAAAGVTDISGRILCDDGCVVYVNGVQVYATTNITLPVAAGADATGTLSETAFINWSANLAALGITLNVGNNNVFAVELHQAGTGSSDIGFDASLATIGVGGQSSLRANDSVTAPTTSTNIYYYDPNDPVDPITAQFVTGNVYDLADSFRYDPVGTVTITPATGGFTYTPRDTTFYGTGVFQYVIIDAANPGFADVAEARITINSVNVPPTGTADSYHGMGGQNFTISVAGGPDRYIDRGSKWFMSEAGTDQSTNIRNAAFNPASDPTWFQAPTEAGFGDGGERMLLTPGRTTYYFAKEFTVTGSVPNYLKLGLRRDDGAIVYVNGIEVFRTNMPGGPVDYNTFSTDVIGSEDTYFEQVFNASAANVVLGTNRITVEVHQVNATSSDMSFDLFLEPVPTPLLDVGAVWFYKDDGTDQSETIRSANFNPATSGWASGAGELGFPVGDGGVTQINGPAFTTYYFARTFDLASATIPSTLVIELLRDDGAIVYINGREVIRDNMPTGPVDSTTFATAQTESETTYFQHFINTAGLNLKPTGNLITVEVHQANATSDDLSFDMRISTRERLGLLANDLPDPDGDTISVLAGSIVTTNLTVSGQPGAPALGTVAVNPDGTFTFNGIAGRDGTGTFTYRISDGSATPSAPVTVTITLTPDESPPVVAADDSGGLYTTVRNTPLTIGANVPATTGIGVGLLSNDTVHPDDVADPVSIRIVRQPTSGGTVVVHAVLPGAFTYTPGANFSGIDTFDYVVSNGFDDSNVATVSILVMPNEDGNPFSSVGPTIDLANLGTSGFTIDGAVAGGFSGYAISSAGDLNNDGLADVVVGAHNATVGGRTQAGETYVVFGRTTGMPAAVDPATLNGSNGFRIRGAEAFDRSGFSVHTAGDVNGDGIDDLLIGTFDLDATAGIDKVGQAYVVFGRTTAFPATLDLSALNGSNGFQFRGQNAFDYTGRAVSSAGDINGDGFDDILIGAPEASPNGARSGRAYVVLGRGSGFPALLTPASLTGTNGFAINGAATGDYAGFSVAAAGDVNGDGFDDMLIGAERADPGGRNQAGRAYVVFGKAAAFGPQFELSSLGGTNGFALSGEAEGDLAGRSVAGAGDVNGDGFDDVIVGAPDHSVPGGLRVGQAHIVFGKSAPFDAEMQLGALNGTNGFTLVGIDPADRAGRSVDGAGDVNGDGFDDVIVGALRGDPQGRTDAGEAYLIFGKASGFAASQSLAALDGLNGITIQGAAAGDLGGLAVAGTGDVNGDGFDDVAFGAYYADPNGVANAGRGYVIYGRQFDALDFAVENLVAAAEGALSGFDLVFENYGRPHVLNIDWGDGQVELFHLDAATDSKRVEHVYADNRAYQAVATLVDQTSPSRVAVESVSVAVTNALPVVAPVGNRAAVEGAVFSLAGIATFSDAGFANPGQPGGATTETFTYVVDWGDGSPVSTGAATITSAGSPGVPTLGTIPATHRYPDNGSYQASIVVTDDDGGASAAMAFTVNVTGQAPLLELSVPHVTPEGSLFTLTGTFTDAGFSNPNHPGGVTVESFNYVVYWGDGTPTVVRPVTNVTPGGPGQPTVGQFQATHRFADGGSYLIQVVVVDDDGNSVSRSISATVTNVAPALTVVGDQSALHGVPLSITNIGQFIDPGFTYQPSGGIGSTENFTYQIDWGDGSALTVGTPTIDIPGAAGIPTQGSFDGTYTYTTTGVYTVTVTVRDDEAGTGIGTFQVSVTGIPPVLTNPAQQIATEGTPLSIAELVAFTDSDGGTYNYTIDWGDGTTVTTGTPRRGEAFAEDLNTTNLSGAGNASRIAHPRADAARSAFVAMAPNGVATESFESFPAGAITIPRFLNFGGQTAVLTAGNSILELPSITFNGAYPTSGNKFLMVEEGPLGPVFSIDFAQPQIGIGFYVTDAENPGNISVELLLADGVTKVRRALPTMASSAPGNINDGSVAYYGLVDPHQPFIRFTVIRNSVTADGFGFDEISLVLPGGGAAPPIANSLLYASGVATNAIVRGVIGGSHVYADNGLYSAKITVTDGSGASSFKTFNVTVGNVMPTLALGGATQTVEGSPFLLTVGSVTDPGNDMVSEWRIDWGDGTAAQIYSTAPGTISHVFADGPAARTITVSLADEDGSYAAVATHTVSVLNVNPTVNVGSALFVDVGATVLRAGSFLDPGGDSWTAEVDYDNGAGFVPLALTPNKEFTFSLNYSVPGARTVRVRITDDDGGVGTASLPVVVRSAAPNVTLDPDVALGWIGQFGTSAIDEARAVAVDSAGNTYFAGYTQGDLFAANAGFNDVIVGKLDPAGNRLWAIQFGTLEGDVARGVGVDAEGNVFVSGDTIGNLGGQNAGEIDAFLSKFTADGQRLWTRQLGTAALDVNRGLALDADGNVYVVGGTNGDLGGTNQGGADGYIAKYDNDGNLLWTRMLGTTADNENFQSVAVDFAGNVYAAGLTNGSLDGPNAGLLDAFVARYDRDGNRIWVRQVGTDSDEIGHNVRVDASGNVYTTGTTGGSLAGQNKGGTDYFVQKFNPQGTRLWALQDGTSAADQQRGLAISAEGNVLVVGATEGSFARPNLGSNDLFVARYDTDGQRQEVSQYGTSSSDAPWGAEVDTAGNVYLAAMSRGSLAANNAGTSDVVLAKLSATAIATEATPLVAVDLATFSDFDVGNYTYSIDWGDGTPASTGNATIDVTDGQPNSVKLGSFDGQHTYADNGQYHVVVRLTDPTGQTTVRSFFATVANVVPTVSLGGAAQIEEGSTYVLAVGAVSDAGPDVVAEWRIDWGDGTPVEMFTAPPGNVSHVLADGPAERTISISLVDEDGIHVGGSRVVDVTNAAPVVDAGEDATIEAGDTLIRNGVFVDPGADTWTAEVDYGVGAGFVPLALGPGKQFSLSQQYATPGTRTVTVRVSDGDGGVGTDSFSLTVAPTFVVSNFTPTATGFVVDFARSANTSFVNLYDGPDVEVEPTDVEFIGNVAGPVAGSLVWNAVGDRATFIRTGAPLSADTYTVRLKSRATGFVDTLGRLLDGNGDFTAGDDFVAGFTVAASAARTVSMPDIVRGPSQTVNIPNTSTGLPIRISDGAGVLSVDLDIVYDPALLNISAIARGAGVPANWTVTANLSQPGRARVTASGVAALAAGVVDVLRLTASVPASAPIGAAQIVRLENVRLNGGLIASTADAALHKVAFLADVDGNFAYTAFDAAFVSRVVVGLDTGFDAFPLVDPTLIGNSSGTGSLSGLDAAYVAQKAVFLPRPEIPDLPPNLPAPSPAAVDPAIGVPAAVFAQAGSSARVPVTVDNLAGLFGVTFRVHYETGPLDLTNEQTALDSELEAAGWSLVQNVDDASGVAYFAAFTSQPGTAGEATLVEMRFDSLASAIGPTTLDLSGPASDGGFAFTYVDGTLTLVAAGDVNGDGFVGLADLIAVQRNLGKLADAVWTDGDLDGDGDVDRADVAIIAVNYGGRPAPDAPPQDSEAIVTAAPRGSALVARRRAVTARSADAVLADSMSDESTPTWLRSVARATRRSLRMPS